MEEFIEKVNEGWKAEVLAYCVYMDLFSFFFYCR